MRQASSEDPKSSPENDRQDHLRLHLKALDAGLWDFDMDTGSVSCDARWYAIFGLPEGSVKRIEDFSGHIHPDDVEHATSVDLELVAEMIARDERYHVDFRITRPDGELRTVRSVACLTLDPVTGHRLAIGCMTDTTDSIGPALPAAEPEASPPASEDGAITDNALTAREIECLRWVSLGKTAWETATIMGRSQRTVEFHLANAMRRLSAANKIHAAVIAVRNGLI